MAKTMQLLSAAKVGFTTLSPDRKTVVSFDREGRLYTFFKDGVTYRRSLASTVDARWREGGRRRRRLSPEEAAELFAEAYRTAAACYPHADAVVRKRLDEEILRWTPQRLLEEGKRFAAVYKPISILPPDHYLSIVLQATEGCTWNRCTFCNFYQDRPFRAKTEEEFARHVDQVRRFLGRGVLMRKGLFLADGNALALAPRRLESLLALARSAFPGQSVYSFIDLYTGERKAPESWRRLAELGLHRVYIGMETGLDELLRFLNKPGSAAELVRFVSDLKAAGLAVGLIVMVGVGGREFRESHARTTLETIARMPLSQGDLIYLSPFIEQPGTAYVQRRIDAALTPMSAPQIEAELDRLARALRARGLKAARYDIREFVY